MLSLSTGAENRFSAFKRKDQKPAFLLHLGKKKEKLSRTFNHIRRTPPHFRDPADHESLSVGGWGEGQGEAEGGGRIPLMDPLTKTGPISGAAGARGKGRRLAAGCGFGSVPLVSGEEKFLSEASWHT